MTRVTRTLVLFGLSLALGGCVEISSDDDGGGGGTNGTDGGGDGDGGADGGAGNGDPPSQADIEMTREVQAAAEILGIALHDHVVIGRKGYASFKTLGLI